MPPEARCFIKWSECGKADTIVRAEPTAIKRLSALSEGARIKHFTICQWAIYLSTVILGQTSRNITTN